MEFIHRSIVVGDEFGGIRGVDMEKESVLFHVRGEGEVTGLTASSEDSILVGRKNGALDEILLSKGMPATSLIGKLSSSIVGVEQRRNGSYDVVVVSSLGDVRVVKERNMTMDLNVGGNVKCMSLLGDSVVVGGKEREVEVFNLETGQSTFKAKNVKLDFLGMKTPVDNTAIAAGGGSYEDPFMLCVGSALGKLRIYDTRSGQKRPTIDVKTTPERRNGLEAAVTSIDLARDQRTIMVGDSAGGLFGFEMSTGKMRGAYKGHSGGISAVVCHREDPIVMSVGMDRFLHVHDLASRKETAHTYLQSRLTSAWLIPEEWIISKEEDETAPYNPSDGEEENGGNAEDQDAQNEEEEEDDDEDDDDAEDDDDNKEEDEEDDEEEDGEGPTQPPQKRRKGRI